MKTKFLILENVDRIDQRLSDYVNQCADEYKILDSIAHKSQADVFEFLKQQGATDLVFESTFSNVNQLLHLMGMLIKHQDAFSFYNIRILYPTKDLEAFLNTMHLKDEVFRKLAPDLFKRYNIFSIEYDAYHTSTGAYWNKITHFYDLVKVIYENECFFYEKYPVIDPRSEFRKIKLLHDTTTEKAVMISKTLFDEDLVGFFGEMQAFLEYQEELIADDEGSPDYQSNKEANTRNQSILQQMKEIFKVK